MDSCIFRLKFSSFVHFGSEFKGISLEKNKFTCNANTLFSALCCEYIKNYRDESKLILFKELFENNKLSLSGLFPFEEIEENNGDSKIKYYIPKPLVNLKNGNNKDLKKIQFIQYDKINDYINKSKAESYIFGAELLSEKVGIENNKIENDLYSIAGFKFKDNCGLYFVLKYEDSSHKELIYTLLKSLETTGIGGKRTVGYGQFIIEEPCENILLDKSSNQYLLLSNLIIGKDDNILDNDNFQNESNYNIIPVNGFVNFATKDNVPYKRKLTNMIEAGSVLSKPIEGIIKNVDKDDANTKHEVWLYGKGFYIQI